MYLEISGRGTGKTYRLIRAARAYISDRDNVANIIGTSEQGLKYIKEELEKDFLGDSKQVRYTLPERKNAIVMGYGNVRNFYDDFDFMNLNFNKNGGFFYSTSQDDYYVTNPAKIRDLSKTPIEEAAKTDFLLKLLLENHGMYVSFIYGQYFISPAWLQDAKEKLNEETFQREVEGRFFKY